MKKTFEFLEEPDRYVLKNTNPSEKKDVFYIKKDEMQFDTNLFYEYVFSDITNKMDIEILNKTDEQNKESKRVFGVVSDITVGINEKMNEKCF